MTYKNLIKLVNLKSENNYSFDLMPEGIKSKIIFAVGDGASNVANMLSSVMSACELPHSRYINIDYLELRERFIQLGKQIPIDEICKAAESIKRRVKGIISGDDMLLSLSLSLLRGEYIIIEMSEDYYNSIINRINFIPHTLLLCSLDDNKNAELIDITPKTTHICALSQKENHDYISPADENGRKIILVSKNKYLVKSSNLLGSDFYHFSYLYHLPCIDLNNILLAAFVIESATTLFGAPRAYIYKGLSTASLPCDLKLVSISPTVLLKIGNDNFKLPKNLVFEKITNTVPSQKPISNTIFYGNAEYIEKVKKAMQ